MQPVISSRPHTQMPRTWQRARAADIAIALSLGLVALGLRLPWAGRVMGESDCARFLIGLRQWFQLGAGAAGIYDKTLCPGFYWLAGMGLRWGITTRELAMVSAGVTASAMLPVYWMGQVWLRRREASLAAVIWMLAPGWWWLGLEVHPEAWALAAGLWSLWAWVEFWKRGGLVAHAWIWFATALGLLSCMLLLDAGLAPWATAFWGVSLVLAQDHLTGPGSERAWKRRLRSLGRGAVTTLSLWIVAVCLFALARHAILGAALAPGSTRHALAQFWQWPQGVQWLKQLLPLGTGLGLGSWMWIGLGLLLYGGAKWRHHSPIMPPDSMTAIGMRELWMVCLFWSLPGWIFWLMVRGNNVRHVMIFSLPWIWLGLLSWHAWARRADKPRLNSFRSRLRFGWPYAAAAGLLAANFWLIPANSNLTLYPSGNVPGSVRDFQRKQAVMRRVALRLARPANSAPSGPVCYLGLSTNPYLEYLLRRQPGARLEPTLNGVRLEMAGGERIHFFDITSLAAWRAGRARCATAYSLEFALRRKHLWFMGNEWRHLPAHGRWYAAQSSLARLPASREEP